MVNDLGDLMEFDSLLVLPPLSFSLSLEICSLHLHCPPVMNTKNGHSPWPFQVIRVPFEFPIWDKTNILDLHCSTKGTLVTPFERFVLFLFEVMFLYTLRVCWFYVLCRSACIEILYFELWNFSLLLPPPLLLVGKRWCMVYVKLVAKGLFLFIFPFLSIMDRISFVGWSLESLGTFSFRFLVEIKLVLKLRSFVCGVVPLHLGLQTRKWVNRFSSPSSSTTV